MSKLKSIFGTYAERLQVMVDNSLDRFAPTFFQKYFDFGTPQTTLTFVTAIGRSRIEAAASIVSRDARTPLRSRPALEKLSGEVPAIREMFKMSDADYRNFLMLQSTSVSDETKKRQIMDYIFADTKKVGDAAMKKIDLMVLEAMSTGVITVDTTNNPDGIIASTPIDLLMPAANFKTATASWDTPASGKPLTDFNAVVTAGQNAGKRFDKALMTRSRFLKMAACDEVRNMISGFLRINSKDQVTPTIDQVNNYLTANLLPTIEIVDEVIGVEKDGVITAIRPWKDDNVSFLPAGRLGVIHNALAIEELRPVSAVTYAKFRNALISKWSENEPFGEYTKVELNAFPGFEAIDYVYILDTTP